MQHEPLQQLAWYHLIFDVPKTWEVRAYKANTKDGQIVLADRHGETMRVYWKTTPREPDLVRCLAEVAADYTADGVTQDAIRASIYELGGWRVYVPKKAGFAALACRQEKEEGALLYVIFPEHDATRDPRVFEAVLTSYRTNYGDDRVWAAFGIDVSIPKEMELLRVSAFPAAQTMYFENKRGESVAVHRYGMASFLLEEDDLTAFVARRIGRRRRLYTTPVMSKPASHPGIDLTYTTRGSGGMASIMARTWQGRIVAWQCPDLERIYLIDNNARAKSLLPDLYQRVRAQ